MEAVPGPNAAVMALTLSGLPPHPFLFVGFLPPKAGARQAALAKLRAAERAGLSATLIFYEAPHRLADSLTDMAAAFGDRPAAVTRELTKRFEEVRRGGLPDLAAHYALHEARGEITLVVGPAPEEAADAGELDRLLEASLKTLSVREAAAAVSEATGVARKVVYARAFGVAWAVGSGKGKQFFVETKIQNTLSIMRPFPERTATALQKSFGSFLQKRMLA